MEGGNPEQGEQGDHDRDQDRQQRTGLSSWRIGRGKDHYERQCDQRAGACRHCAKPAQPDRHEHARHEHRRTSPRQPQQQDAHAGRKKTDERECDGRFQTTTQIPVEMAARE
jgi:hypothetical protein